MSDLNVANSIRLLIGKLFVQIFYELPIAKRGSIQCYPNPIHKFFTPRAGFDFSAFYNFCFVILAHLFNGQKERTTTISSMDKGPQQQQPSKLQMNPLRRFNTQQERQ
jgi:hypothetical protein